MKMNNGIVDVNFMCGFAEIPSNFLKLSSKVHRRSFWIDEVVLSSLSPPPLLLIPSLALWPEYIVHLRDQREAHLINF